MFDTKSRLKYGLIKALTQKPLYELKDLDVIKCAEVAPATFYKYYANKVAILEDIEHSLIEAFKTSINEDMNAWYKLKFSPSKKNINQLLKTEFTYMLDFFAENSREILVLVSNNGDPLLRNKMVDILSQRLSHLFMYYFRLYNQEGMLKNKPIFFNFLGYREANDIVNTLIYWVRFKNKMTVDDAKNYLVVVLTRSAYDITAHGFN